MKIKDGYVLRKVADNWVVLPVGKASVNLNGMLSLNESGVLLWQKLNEGSDREALVDVLLSAYEVSHDEASADVDGFIASLLQYGCIDT
jgi:hypothetical protein